VTRQQRVIHTANQAYASYHKAEILAKDIHLWDK